MAGKPKGDVPLTGRERNRAYRVRKQREDREVRRKLADCAEALQRIAFEARTVVDARNIALHVLSNAG